MVSADFTHRLNVSQFNESTGESAAWPFKKMMSAAVWTSAEDSGIRV